MNTCILEELVEEEVLDHPTDTVSVNQKTPALIRTNHWNDTIVESYRQVIVKDLEAKNGTADILYIKPKEQYPKNLCPHAKEMRRYIFDGWNINDLNNRLLQLFTPIIPYRTDIFDDGVIRHAFHESQWNYLNRIVERLSNG